jgi:5-methylcytosine-specific restriction endonuclease McrA
MKKAYSHRCPDAARLWADLEDHFVPRFDPLPSERSLYFHLLRRTHLLCRRKLVISMEQLAGGVHFTRMTVIKSLRRLQAKGVVSITGRGIAGHEIRVKLPSEIPGCLPSSRLARAAQSKARLESGNFFETRSLRRAIFRREQHRCFYCLRPLRPWNSTLDHVQPRSLKMDHSYRNLVAACLDCNSRKGRRGASRFLRELYRQEVLSARDFRSRRYALRALKQGRRKPILENDSSWRDRT